MGLTKASSFYPASYTQASNSLPFKTETPGNNRNIFRQAHRLQHFWPEHSTVAYLHPLTQLIRVTAFSRSNVKEREFEGAREEEDKGVKHLNICICLCLTMLQPRKDSCCFKHGRKR